MGDNGDSRPMISVQMGAVDVMVCGGPDDDLDAVRGQFDHAFSEALDGAERLDDVGPI